VHGHSLAARNRLNASAPALRDAAAGLLGFAAIFPLALFDGGYFPTAWGVSALVGLWVVAIALSVAPAPLHRLEAVALAALAGLLGWSALSLFWTTARPKTVLELERLTIYLAVLAAVLFVARRESVPWLLAGASAAIVVTCVVGLAGRLFQDVFGRPDARLYDVTALYAPLGYSNALGDLSAVGVLLLAGFLTKARQPAARALTAGALVVLLAALALSLSRGAWVALGTGTLVAVALAPSRAQLLGRLAPVVPPGAATVTLCLRADELITRGASEAAAVREGHRLALAIAALATGAAVPGTSTVSPAPPETSTAARTEDLPVNSTIRRASSTTRRTRRRNLAARPDTSTAVRRGRAETRRLPAKAETRRLPVRADRRATAAARPATSSRARPRASRESKR